MSPEKTYIPTYVARKLVTDIWWRHLGDEWMRCGQINYFSEKTLGEPLRNYLSGHYLDPAVYHGMPMLWFVADALVYVGIPLKDSGFLVGPVRLSQPVFIRHSITKTDLGFDENWQADDELIRQSPVCSVEELIDNVLLLSNCELYHDRGTYYSREDVLEANCTPDSQEDDVRRQMTSLVFESLEKGFVHNPYGHEIREVNAIETGDREAIEEVLAEYFPGRYGVLSDNPLTQEILMGVVIVTIATRSAIRGGLHAEEAYSLSDVYIRNLQKCTDPEAARQLYRQCERECTGLVADIRADRERNSGPDEHPYISRAKDYIFANLHGKILVQDIAASIGLDADYLSALFHREEGVTLKQYIQNQKCTLVKHMLTYSDYNYSAIANYLGFASQSHMGTVFRKETGMTLKQYRDRYSRDDFIGRVPQQVP